MRSSSSHVLAPISSFFGAVAMYFAACLLLGGATRPGFLSDVALQVAAVPLLFWAAWRLIDIPEAAGRRQARLALLICLSAAALPLLQLVPLPPSLWTALPGRADVMASLKAAGLGAGWRPLSLSPPQTWLSVLALLPPATVFLSTVQLGFADRRKLVLVFLIFGALSAVLGLLQVAQGPNSPLRFYAFTNATEAVGFFAYRNHYAALIYCVVLFAGAWMIASIARARRKEARSRRGQADLTSLRAVLSALLLAILLAAQAVARSRAGLGLTFLGLLGIAAMAYTRTGHRQKVAAPATGLVLRWGLAFVALVFFLTVPLTLERLAPRFEADLLSDGRWPMARNTIEAAWAFMPFGSGMGTFVSSYAAFEGTPDDFVWSYVNHAHNDFLEFWLEGGLPAILIMGAFLIWFVWISVRVWGHGLTGAHSTDRILALAATLVIALLLIHASIDYILRATALMALFALAVALVVAPIETLSEDSSEPRQRRRRHDPNRASVRPREKEIASGEAAFVPREAGEEWPAAWRKPRGSDDPDHGSPTRP